MSGGLFAAVGIGIAGALGLSWWASRKSDTGGKSACEAACIATAKASGATGNLDALCAGSCGILGSVAQAVKDIANPCPNGSHKDDDYEPAIADHRREGPGPLESIGQSMAVPAAMKKALQAVDRGIRPLVTGACRDDKTNAIIGYLGLDGFHPWSIPEGGSATPAPPPPTVPTPSPTDSPRGPRGGVSVS